MGRKKSTQILILLIHAFTGWALCGGLMMGGRAVTTLQTALIIHAIGAPLFLMLISLLYFKKFHFTRPLTTAIIFTGFAIFMDIFLVAMIIEQSYEMFTSFIGTWLPLTLIFISVYVTGFFITRKQSGTHRK